VVLGERTVLDRLTVEVRSGQFIALLGANGSGKTTLVRAMLGLVPRENGSVELFGTPLERFRHWERIGYVPQRFGAGTSVPATVEEIVLTGRIPFRRRGLNYSAEDRAAAARSLKLVGLANLGRRRIATLSGGQQQRALIARALVNDPELLVLDEPVSSVDLAYQESFAATLRALPETNTVLLLAHSLGVMRPLVDRTIVLDEGRIVYDGPPRAEHMRADEHHHFEGQVGR
jgi:zinc transport system ATP-binding protein